MKKNFVSSQLALAGALDVCPRTVRNWLKLPHCPGRRPDGRFDVAAWKMWQSLFANVPRQARGNSTAVQEKLKNLELLNEKLEFQLRTLRKEFVSSADVEQWGAELGMEIRKVVTSIHLVAPSLTGLPIAEVEIRLKELEDEILSKLHLLNSRVRDMKEAADAG